MKKERITKQQIPDNKMVLILVLMEWRKNVILPGTAIRVDVF